MSELKPCPFCGGERITEVVIGSHYRSYTCVKCHAVGMVMNDEAKQTDVINGWNNRPCEAKLMAKNAELINEIARVLEQTGVKRDCEWRIDFDGNFETGCGESFCFETGDITDNHYSYCPGCGGKIVVMVEEEEEEEEDE